MTRTRHCLEAATIVAFLLMVIFSTVTIASAVPPSECQNRVDAKILSIKVNNGKKTIDVAKDHAIDAKIQKGYNVRVQLQTTSKYTGDGRPSIWLTTTAYGFSSGTCFDNVKISNSERSRISLTFRDIQMGQAVEGLEQQVKWGSWPNTDQISYDVRWH